jgi:phosphoribosylanthranilate isomerase
MQRVRAKIEGLREPAVAVDVARMGADAIGLVFADSPRKVTPETARMIVAALPPWVATVGVFVNAEVGEINAVVERTGIGYVQLHGDEGPDVVAGIAAPCIKAFRVRDAGFADEVRAWLGGLADRSNFSAVLLDAYDSNVRGGSGTQFNWDLVADARGSGQLDDIGPILLAGGLDPSSVREAIETVRPWGVDVASGVESAPGVKDMQKVADFLRAVRETDEP